MLCYVTDANHAHNKYGPCYVMCLKVMMSFFLSFFLSVLIEHSGPGFKDLLRDIELCNMLKVSLSKQKLCFLVCAPKALYSVSTNVVNCIWCPTFNKMKINRNSDATTKLSVYLPNFHSHFVDCLQQIRKQSPLYYSFFFPCVRFMNAFERLSKLFISVQKKSKIKIKKNLH